MCHFKKIEMLFCDWLKGISILSHRFQRQHALNRPQQHLVRVLRNNRRLPVLLRLHHPLLRRNLRHQHLPTWHLDDHPGVDGLTVLPNSQPDWADFRQHHGEPLDSRHRHLNDSRRALDSVHPTNGSRTLAGSLLNWNAKIEIVVFTVEH